MMITQHTPDETVELLSEVICTVQVTRADALLINSLLGIINPMYEKSKRKREKSLSNLMTGLWAGNIITLPLLDTLAGYGSALFGDLSPADIVQLHPQSPQAQATSGEIPMVSFGNDETDRKEEFLASMEAQHGKAIADKFRDAMYQ